MKLMTRLRKAGLALRKTQVFADNLDVTMVQSPMDPDRKLYSLVFSDTTECREVRIALSHDDLRNVIGFLNRILAKTDQMGVKP